MDIETLKMLSESEDRVEFKEAKRNFNFDGGTRSKQKERRKCFLGYIVALANEGGGRLVLGMDDSYPHVVTGTKFFNNQVGTLEDKVYENVGIRVHCEQLYEDNKIVLLTTVPPRPIGKLLKFEGVPLMRTGDSLRNMSDDEIYEILSEQEPDFSSKICSGLKLRDLDDDAFDRMISNYQEKNPNSHLKRLSKSQILSDLKLLSNKKLNYAALILLGKSEKIEHFLPQCKIIWEFRNSSNQIHYDRREEIQKPLFLAIDAIWKLINQPTLNLKHPIQYKGNIFDIYDFNEEVIREALLNAIAHRDYTINSEILVKQYPNKIIFSNPGGFPKGVNLDNILIVNSTPRSRLMTEVMEKTGLVERSGQGVDKIFLKTLSEGKLEPSYKASDIFQVTLELYSQIEDKAFHLFIQNYRLMDKEPKLGIEQIIILYKINKGMQLDCDIEKLKELESINLIQKVSSGSKKYILADKYQTLYKKSVRIGNRYLKEEIKIIISKLQDKKLKIGELEDDVKEYLNRNQIKYLLNKLLEDEIIQKEGIGKGTYYFINNNFYKYRGNVLVEKIIGFLSEKYE